MLKKILEYQHIGDILKVNSKTFFKRGPVISGDQINQVYKVPKHFRDMSMGWLRVAGDSTTDGISPKH